MAAAFVEMLWMNGPKVSGLAQCDSEECRLRVVMKADTVSNDRGLPVRLMAEVELDYEAFYWRTEGFPGHGPP